MNYNYLRYFSVLAQLEHLAADYGLEMNNFITIFDDEVEGELDD